MKILNRNNANLLSYRPVKIIQFGTGNFLRGFVDWVIDILNEKADFNADIQVVQPHGKSPATVLNEQDGLYHVVTQGYRNGQVVDEARLISCVRPAINSYLEYSRYLQLAENAELRFVMSNTTEAGIYFDPQDDHWEKMPNSFPGKLTALLYCRFLHFNGDGTKGLIHLPCELIEQNGVKLKQVVLQYADHWQLEDEFKQWITNDNIFCNTLVDRIVPGFPHENADAIQQRLGYKDGLMVTAEPFHLWIIEGPHTVVKELPLEASGLDVFFVEDLSPYRTRKVRILNGAHTVMVPLAYLKGYRTVKEAVEAPEIKDFLNQVIFEEIIPTLDLSREELEKFAGDVIERFRNPFIKHQLKDIALNSISKFQVRVLPSLLAYHNGKKMLPENLVLALAALIVFYRGNYGHEVLPVRDTPTVIKFFQEVWSNEDVLAIAEKVLGNTDLWQTNLNDIDKLPELLAEKISLLLGDQEK